MKKNIKAPIIILIFMILIGTFLPSNTIHAAGSWEDYLDGKSAEQENDFVWNTSITDTTKIWDGTTAEITDIDGEGFYRVKTPQEFRWALENNKNVRLDNDIDLGGRDNINWAKIAGYEITNKIDGQNHIVYNLNTTDNGMLERITTGFELKNISFNNFKVISKSGSTGIISAAGQNYTIDNVRVNDSLVVGDGDSIAVLIGEDILGATVNTLNNVVIKNSSVIAKSGRHHSILMGSWHGTKVTNSATIDCVLVSYGAHSGGFIGCCDNSGSTVDNCFSNSTVYGNRETAAFAGYSTNVEFNNCYVSGKVEGTFDISGFAYIAKKISNSYTTAMVGMQNGGRHDIRYEQCKCYI